MFSFWKQPPPQSTFPSASAPPHPSKAPSPSSNAHSPTPSTAPPPPPPSSSTTSSNSNSITSPRSLRQFTLFAAGASFLLFSTLITRRSLHRRYKLAKPAFYYPSNLPPRTPINGALEALEALNIATINVASVSIMMVGGALWAFDISGMEELRQRVRGGLGVDGSGREEKDVEEEFEEWLAGTLERKRKKEVRGERGGEEEVEVMKTNERGKVR